MSVEDLLNQFALSDDEAAGEKLFEDLSELKCRTFIELDGITLCARAVFRDSLKARLLALKILANVSQYNPEALAEDSAGIAVASAFCLETNTSEISLEACWIFSAMIGAWRNIMTSEILLKRIAKLCFTLTSSLNPNKSEIQRNNIEEILIAKLFELIWRLDHTQHPAFSTLYGFTHTRCILTSALEYALDPMARMHKDLKHRLETGQHISGLDCSLRVLYSIAQLDVKHLNALGPVTPGLPLYSATTPATPTSSINTPSAAAAAAAKKNKKNTTFLRLKNRLQRISDCAKDLSTLSEHNDLSSNEAISVQLVLVQSVWPFHNFETELTHTYNDYTLLPPPLKKVTSTQKDALLASIPKATRKPRAAPAAAPSSLSATATNGGNSPHTADLPKMSDQTSPQAAAIDENSIPMPLPSTGEPAPNTVPIATLNTPTYPAAAADSVVEEIERTPSSNLKNIPMDTSAE